MLKRNLIANYLGQGWSALMGLAFIPLYIKYLGIEAFGLIGLFAVLQAWLGLLDMGMTPTLGREMARFTGGSHTAESIRDLLRSIEIIGIAIAVLVIFSVAFSANWITSDWLKTESLPKEVVANSLVIMGFISAVRFVEGIYRSAIMGLQRQVAFNVVNSLMATLRGLGAVFILAMVSPTIQAYFIWQGVVSVLTLITLAIITYNSLPRGERAGRFSLDALRSVSRFAGGIIGITFLALLLTQVDKLVLSSLLNLSEYGYYILATTVATALYVAISPISQAWYPRLCELHDRGKQSELIETYHKGAQLVSVVAGSGAIAMILFAESFLMMWTQNHELTTRVAPILRILIVGNMLNGLMYIPYQAQLAHGWTSFALWINLIAVTILIPAIFWVTPNYGAEGAAWVWVILNACYVLFGVHFMYQRILRGEKWYWYLKDLIAPLGAGLSAGVLLYLFWPYAEGLLAKLVQLAMASSIIIFASLFAASLLRQHTLNWLRAIFLNMLENSRNKLRKNEHQ